MDDPIVSLMALSLRAVTTALSGLCADDGPEQSKAFTTCNALLSLEAHSQEGPKLERRAIHQHAQGLADLLSKRLGRDLGTGLSPSLEGIAVPEDASDLMVELIGALRAVTGEDCSQLKNVGSRLVRSCQTTS
jgi:hypothetical protein